MRNTITIGDRPIGSGHPCLIIAEAGVNHNGDLHRALELIDVASDAGADAVKFQSFSTERLVTRTAPKAAYQIEATGSGESQYAMLAAMELSFDDHRALARRASERGIIFLSTPFDEASADMLERLDVVAFKTPSGELTNIPFLEHVARFGKPMIVSTGMATLGEVDTAVEAIAATGLEQLALLHCVSNYPADPGEVNLSAMHTLATAFGVPIGYSDHTLDIEIAVAAIALGACVLEKHFTLDRSLPGPDHRASLEPDALRALVRAARAVEAALGDGRKRPTESERSTAAAARKSLVAARRIAAGSRLANDDVVAMRPGTGIPIALRNAVIGRRVHAIVEPGTVLTWDMFE